MEQQDLKILGPQGRCCPQPSPEVGEEGPCSPAHIPAVRGAGGGGVLYASCRLTPAWPARRQWPL